MILRRKHTRRLTWILSFILYAQALFPVQAHTRLEQTASGLYVTVCTLQGNAQVQLDEPFVPSQGSDEHRAGYSAAVAFSLIIGQALLANVPDFYIATPTPSAEPVLYTYQIPQRLFSGIQYPRGPPA